MFLRDWAATGGCEHGEYADKSNPTDQKCVACTQGEIDSDANAGTPCIPVRLLPRVFVTLSSW